ncbi:hypothetical protein SLS60_008099 [Paraconiothyrium brasiliense]|uniref:Uncharacterized protein n=1 Tax=Paraconiothyrium brasiliense TaxID=300254 RepID=A0ABR3R3D4_9PLEO
MHRAHDNMTPRYIVSSDDENRAQSSPDPLGASFDEEQSRARSLATRATIRQPLTATSPSKQNRRPEITGLDLASPTKHMLLSTPRTAGHSPWRIKVTVQAEPGSDSENMESPIVKHITHTKTTTIPLKDPDASSPAKRRGRPRKSEAPIKRSGTPVRKRATSKPRRTSVGDNSSADLETDVTPKRKRGRPRKVQLPGEDDIWGQARRSSVGADASAADVETDATPKKRRGRPRKSIQPPPLEEDDEHTAPQSPPLPESVESELHTDTAPGPGIQDDSQPEMDSTPHERRGRFNSTFVQTGLSRRLKARENTPVAKDQDLIEISSDEESEEDDGGDREVTITEEHLAEEDVDNMTHFRSPQASASGTPEDEEEHNEETCFVFEEGATRMPDDTTIIDSESFSMISVDSLPSCGSVTRPANGATGGRSSAYSQDIQQDHACLEIPSSKSFGRGSENTSVRLPPGLLPSVQALPAAPPRYKTPSVEPVELSKPPPVQSARLSPTEAQTPRIGRVVKAGVALQGVLDPNRVTPEAGPSKTVDERRDHLDDLFRGFSERTKRELQAGLRLGEQLAKQSGMNRSPSPALSSPIKTANPDLSAGNSVASSTVPQQSRLLTPEDQDGDTATVSHPTEVQYPILPHSDQRSGLLSPVSNPEVDEDEMSWRIDTPPVQRMNRVDTQLSAPHQTHESARIDMADMWEEEASRPSDRVEIDNASSPGIQDLLAQDGPVKPARGKLPRTWRRKTSDDFQYSDEAQDSQIGTPPSTESDNSPARAFDKVKGTAMQPRVATRFENEDEEVDSEDSDDTGLFFQANIPNLFKSQQSRDIRRRRTQKQEEISLNLDQSLLPESSPPPVVRTPVMDKPNPFMDTPPQLAALRSSPVKSSPLRQELRGSDISSDPAQQTFEESTLPLAPSSPFHTYVEGDTGFSMASDQRQILREMEPMDSSLRRIRDKADEYLDAYEPQERSLHNLTEVTEPSKTWNKGSAMLTSSPPKQKQFVPGPASGNALDKANNSFASSIQDKEDTQQRSDVTDIRTPPCSPSMRTGLPSPAHPALTKLDLLPRVEPWTKTHYKALDRLYQLYKKKPSIFSTTEGPNAVLNATLLTNHLNATTHDFIGARYRAWGYNVIFTDALVVLCTAFMQLLTLNNIEEYEKKAQKEIQVGDCQPGVVGSSISVEGVVERLATIVLGEAVRRDEKKGKLVDKSGRLRVEWPQ